MPKNSLEDINNFSTPSNATAARVVSQSREVVSKYDELREKQENIKAALGVVDTRIIKAKQRNEDRASLVYRKTELENELRLVNTELKRVNVSRGYEVNTLLISELRKLVTNEQFKEAARKAQAKWELKNL